jgi:hypothetical protein
MSAAFDRDALLDAFDRIGRAAALAGTKLQIAVYGGSALMLASNFRFTTEDVDVSKLEHPLPDVVGIATVEEAIALLGRYFPLSAASSEKQQFLLKNMTHAGAAGAPKYLG